MLNLNIYKEIHWMDPVLLSQKMLNAVRNMSDEVPGLWNSLAHYEVNEFTQKLADDHLKKVFWINVYNAGVQWQLRLHPAYYGHRGKFYQEKYMTIAGHSMSLDDIEHGILRHSKIKWAMGYLNKLMPDDFERRCRVNQLDYRIHFALNCGAKSCPPIAFYEPASLDKQLELATANYLQNETKYDRLHNTLYLPMLIKWYRGDFGKQKDMFRLFYNHHILPAGIIPKIKFKSYDWTLYLNYYKQ